MNELDLVLSWLASVTGGADCGICNLLYNAFNTFNSPVFGTGALGAGAAAVGTAAGNVIRDPIGTASDAVTGAAGAAGTVAGTAVNVAGTVAGAAVDTASGAASAFNQGYQNAGGGTGSTPAPSSTVTAGPPEIQGPPPRHPFARDPEPQPPGAIPHGTLQYFGVGGPTGPGMGNQQ